MNTWIVYALVFLAFVLPVLFWKPEQVGRSLNPQGDQWRKVPWILRVFFPFASAFETSLGVFLANRFPARRKRYEKLIAASALPLKPEHILLTQVSSALMLVGVGCLLLFVPGMRISWCVGVMLIGLFIGWFYPASSFASYVVNRQGEITKGLPFAIDLIGSAMRAGLEFGAAMRYYVNLNMGGALSYEFGKVLQQVELGKTRSEALADMAQRVQVEAFTAFVGVVAYGTEIGASIVDTLKIHGEELRRARFHLAERKAARAPSIMILPLGVFIMPAVFIIIITPVIMQMSATGLGHLGQ